MMPNGISSSSETNIDIDFTSIGIDDGTDNPTVVDTKVEKQIYAHGSTTTIDTSAFGAIGLDEEVAQQEKEEMKPSTVRPSLKPDQGTRHLLLQGLLILMEQR